MSRFSRATKASSRARVALCGPAGSGKTYSALAIACALGKRVAVIDTERGSASKYAHRFTFDVLSLETHEMRHYIDAIADAEREGYDVVVIDSLSHAWMGRGGALEQVDRKRGGSGSSFDAWRSVSPEQARLVDAMLQGRAHVIATMRTKTEYVVETNQQGKAVPRKVGLAPVQRDGLEYEFDVVGDLDADHVLTVTKSRCEALADQRIDHPGRALADTLRAWLSDGVPPTPAAPATPVGPRVAAEGSGFRADTTDELRAAMAPAVAAAHAARAAAQAPSTEPATLAELGQRAVEAAAAGDARGLEDAYVRSCALASSEAELDAIGAACKAEPLFAGLPKRRPEAVGRAYAARLRALREVAA